MQNLKFISDTQFKKWPKVKRDQYLSELAVEIQQHDYNNDSHMALEKISEYEKKYGLVKQKSQSDFKDKLLPMIKRNINEKLAAVNLQIDEAAAVAQESKTTRKEKIKWSVLLGSKKLKKAILAAGILLLVGGLGKLGKTAYENYQVKSNKEKIAAQAKLSKEKSAKEFQANQEALEIAKLKAEKQKQLNINKASKKKMPQKVVKKPIKIKESEPVYQEPPVQTETLKKKRPKRIAGKDNTGELLEKVK